MEPWIIEKTCQTKFAAHGVADDLPQQQFYILVIKFSPKAVHIPKHIVGAYTTWSPTAVMTAQPAPLPLNPIKASKSVDPTSFGNAYLRLAQSKKITAHSETQQAQGTKMNNTHTLIAAVHWKPTIHRYSQIWQHICIQSDTPEELNFKSGKMMSAFPSFKRQTNILL